MDTEKRWLQLGPIHLSRFSHMRELSHNVRVSHRILGFTSWGHHWPLEYLSHGDGGERDRSVSVAIGQAQLPITQKVGRNLLKVWPPGKIGL